MKIKIGTSSHYEDQGTDIYIKKIDQGAGYGSGYVVKVYDYGQMVDEQKVQTKKDVKRIIDEQKSKYMTDRAFEEESHIFVSYRMDDIDSKRFRDTHNLTTKESSMTMDDKLYKQASRINNLLTLSKAPDVPIKFFKKAEELFNFEETPEVAALPVEDTSQITKDNVESVSQQIAEKIDAYLMKTQTHPRDDIFNDLQKYMSTVKSILDNNSYSEEERKDIISTLALRYKNSDIVNADLLLRAASNRTTNKKSSTTNSIISTNILSPQGVNNPQTPTNPTAPNQQMLSQDTQKAVDYLNTMDENDLQGRFNYVNTLPNRDNILKELQTKQLPTASQNSLLNYQANYAEGLYKIAGKEIHTFYNHISKQKGITSFSRSFTKWADSKQYNSLLNFVVDTRKATFIEAEGYQLKNKGALPSNFLEKQAGEAFGIYYLIKYAGANGDDWGVSGAESSQKLVSALRYLFHIDASYPLSTEESVTLAEQNLNALFTNPSTTDKQIVEEVALEYINYAYPSLFKKRWTSQPSTKRTQDDWEKVFIEFWKTQLQANVLSSIASIIVPAMNTVISKSAMDFSKSNPMIVEYIKIVVKQFSAALASAAQSPSNITEALRKAYNFARETWPSTYNYRQSTLKNKDLFKSAVTININEAPSGESSISIEDAPNIPALEDAPTEQDLNFSLDMDDTLTENQDSTLLDSDIVDFPEDTSTASLFDELAV